MISTPAQRAEAAESDGRRLQRHAQRAGELNSKYSGARRLALDAAALGDRRDAPFRLVQADGDADVVGKQGVADAGADAGPGRSCRSRSRGGAVMLAEALRRAGRYNGAVVANANHAPALHQDARPRERFRRGPGQRRCPAGRGRRSARSPIARPASASISCCGWKSRASPGAAVYYRVFNTDGGEAEQCGNGARCIARLIGDGPGPRAGAAASGWHVARAAGAQRSGERRDRRAAVRARRSAVHRRTRGAELPAQGQETQR